MVSKVVAVILDLLTGLVAGAVALILIVPPSFNLPIVFLCAIFVFWVAGLVRGRSRLDNRLADILIIDLFFLMVCLMYALENPVFLIVAAAAMGATYLGMRVRARWATWLYRPRILTVSAVVVAALIVGIFPAAEAVKSFFLRNQAMNTPAPEYDLESLDGVSYSSSELLGKIVVLDFWATWCKPCEEEFPELVKLHDIYKDRSDIMFFAVNAGGPGETPEKVRTFLSDKAVIFPAAMDSANTLKSKFNVAALPTLLMIDKKGVIRVKHQGYYPNGNFLGSMTGHIDRLIAENPGGVSSPNLTP